MLKSFDGIKVGDKLQCVSEKFDMGGVKVGDVVEVIDIWLGFAGRLGIDTEEGCFSSVHANNFELVKEGNMKFDMKTQPWFIRIKSEEQFKAADDWLLENFGQSICFDYSSEIRFLTNTTSGGNVHEDIMFALEERTVVKSGAKEIKLSFKTKVEQAVFPEVETPEQAEIKRLTKIIEDAQESLSKLSNS